LETDPFISTLLEDGARSCPFASNAAASMGGGGHANFRAASWHT